MEYNYCAIGDRIKLERKKLKLSQEALAEKIGTTRQTLSLIERGKYTDYPFSYLVELSKVFDCEIGYLLCEYNCKTRTATDVQKETGLSEKAINTLKEYNEDALVILDTLITENFAPKISDNVFTFFRFDERISDCIPCVLDKDSVLPQEFTFQIGDAASYRLDKSINLVLSQLLYCSSVFNHFCEKVERANAKVQIRLCKDDVRRYSNLLRDNPIPIFMESKTKAEKRISYIQDRLSEIKEQNYWITYQKYYGDDNIYFPSKDNYDSLDDRPDFHIELWHL